MNYMKKQETDAEYFSNKLVIIGLLGAIAVKLEKLVNIMSTSGYEVIYDKYMKSTVDKETQIDKSNSDEKKDTIQGQDGGTSEGQQLTNNIKHKLKEDIEMDIKNLKHAIEGDEGWIRTYNNWIEQKIKKIEIRQYKIKELEKVLEYLNRQ